MHSHGHGPAVQFAKNEDFDQYPRQREADRRMLLAAGCHATFEPASLYISCESTPRYVMHAVATMCPAILIMRWS